jgi:hypothetical protein
MDTTKKCWRYHIVDRVAPDDDAGGYWIFKDGRESVSNGDIKRILGSVSMKTTVVEDPSWRCRHWVWDALAVSLGFD